MNFRDPQVLAYAYWPTNKKDFDKMGRMAMEDDDNEPVIDRGEKKEDS